MNIPDDFPRHPTPTEIIGAVSPPAAQSKRAPPDAYELTDDEVAERFDICNSLATKVIFKLIEKRQVEFASHTEAEILAGVLAWLKAQSWGSPAEMRWVIREAARCLKWTVPDSASERNAG